MSQANEIVASMNSVLEGTARAKLLKRIAQIEQDARGGDLGASSLIATINNLTARARRQDARITELEATLKSTTLQNEALVAAAKEQADRIAQLENVACDLRFSEGIRSDLLADVERFLSLLVNCQSWLCDPATTDGAVHKERMRLINEALDP